MAFGGARGSLGTSFARRGGDEGVGVNNKTSCTAFVVRVLAPQLVKGRCNTSDKPYLALGDTMREMEMKARKLQCTLFPRTLETTWQPA